MFKLATVPAHFEAWTSSPADIIEAMSDPKSPENDRSGSSRAAARSHNQSRIAIKRFQRLFAPKRAHGIDPFGRVALIMGLPQQILRVPEIAEASVTSANLAIKSTSAELEKDT
ncbi:MAG: hypothetical protein IPN48_05330 [Sphingomonadales bacterium]|nr:hypothetical protein [Sphingomonadales bacterium]